MYGSGILNAGFLLVRGMKEQLLQNEALPPRTLSILGSSVLLDYKQEWFYTHFN